jgi:hypothetical protein
MFSQNVGIRHITHKKLSAGRLYSVEWKDDIKKWKRIWKEEVVAYRDENPITWRDREKPLKPTVRIVSVPEEFRTHYLPNVCLKR